jgi:hypothetical protein
VGGKGFNTPMGHVGRIGSKAGQRGDGDGDSEGMMVVCKPQVGDGEKAHETESRELSNVQVTQIGIFEPSEGMCEASPSSTFSSLSLTTLWHPFYISRFIRYNKQHNLHQMNPDSKQDSEFERGIIMAKPFKKI